MGRFTETRHHKHIQRFNGDELRILDEEVARLRTRAGLKTTTRTRVIRVALDAWFCRDKEERVSLVVAALEPPRNRS